MIHRLLILDTGRDDIAGGHGLEAHLVWDPTTPRAFLTPRWRARRMRWETCPRGRVGGSPASSRLRPALLDPLAGLEGSDLQRLQLLLRGVVGRLHCLDLGGHVPQGGPQA
jgi:hypothetical protein